MSSGNNDKLKRNMTKEDAADDLSSVLARSGISASPEQLIELFAAHWSKLSMLSHAIHDDWRRPETAPDVASRVLA